MDANKNWYEEQVNVKQCEQKESTIGSPLLAKCDSFKPDKIVDKVLKLYEKSRNKI